MRRKKMLLLTSCLVWLVALAVVAPVEARDGNAYKKDGASAQKKVTSGVKFVTSSNLAIYAPSLWVVIRYDAESNSLTVTSSDASGPAVWFDPAPHVTGNSITATANLTIGDPVSWVDTLFYDIVIRGGTAYIYETTSDDPVTFLYKGRAVRLVTFF